MVAAVLASVIVAGEHRTPAQRAASLERHPHEVAQPDHRRHFEAQPFGPHQLAVGVEDFGLLIEHETHRPTARERCKGAHTWRSAPAHGPRLPTSAFAVLAPRSWPDILPLAAPLEIRDDVTGLGGVTRVSVLRLQPKREVAPIGDREERRPPPPAPRDQARRLASRRGPQARPTSYRRDDRHPRAASAALGLQLGPRAGVGARLFGEAEHHLTEDVSLHLARARVDRPGARVEERRRPRVRRVRRTRAGRSRTNHAGLARSAPTRRHRGCRRRAR